jgi:hypothetical protein
VSFTSNAIAKETNMNLTDIHKITKWITHLEPHDGVLTDNGYMAICTFDNVLDEENWPISVIKVLAGVIIEQQVIYSGKLCAYILPNMVGMSTNNVYRFIEENDGNESLHPTITNAVYVFKEDISCRK